MLFVSACVAAGLNLASEGKKNVILQNFSGITVKGGHFAAKHLDFDDVYQEFICAYCRFMPIDRRRSSAASSESGPRAADARRGES
jgi:hypothetical protein